MKLNKILFNNKDYVLSGEIDFSDASLDPFHIKKIEPANVKVTGSIFEDMLMLNVEIKVRVIAPCAYTLEDVPLDLKIKDHLEFSDETEEDDTIFYEPKPIFDLDPYILSLIISEVPAKVVKKGAKLPESGKGYRVISEETYNEESKQKIDPRWAKLDDIDL